MIFLIFVSLELAADFTLKDPAPPFPEPDQAPLTLILAGGTIYSGEARPGVAADVGILDDHIVMIGDLSGHSAELRLDVSGLAVTPGLAPGEKDIVGAVVPTDRGSFDIAAAIKACRENLDRNSVPDYLQVLDAIPKTASEKPQERFLVESFESSAHDVYATTDYQ